MLLHTRITRLWLSCFTALLLVLVALPAMAAVHASLDRDKVYIDDLFTLTIEVDGLPSGASPDLAPLEKDFDVLGSSTSTQVSIFNGQRSDKTRWHVQLQPRHLGKLRIPPIEVDGQHTRPMTIEVDEASQQPTAQTGRHVFIESEVDTSGESVYVQQQIPYSVRLYYDDRLQDGKLDAPAPENAVIERLGEEKRYNTIRNGHEYHVIERNYVISAEKSGVLSIPPARFRGRIAMPQQQGGHRPQGLMDEFFANSPFANDPFFRNRLGGGLFDSPFANPGKPVSARGRTIEITIKPRPVTASNPWLPAEALILTDSWTETPPQFKAGEPVTRTLTLQAKGLSGSQIPELKLAAPPNTRIYPENSEQENRTDGETIYGVRNQTFTYIPSTPGTLDIPPVTLKWWNTHEDRPATATLPAWQFKVQPGAPGTANTAPAASPPPPAQPAAKAATGNGTDLPATSTHETAQPHRRWIIGGGALIVLALLLSALVRRTKQHRQNMATTDKKTAAPTAEPSRKSAMKVLQQACAENDRQAASRALMKLAEAHWPDDPPRSLGALAARLENGQSQIRELERSLYAAGNTEWNGTPLWEVLRHGLQEKKTSAQHQDDGLKPLYPQHP